MAPFWIFPAPYEAQCTQEASGMHGLPQNSPQKFKNPLFRVLGVGPEIPPLVPGPWARPLVRGPWALVPWSQALGPWPWPLVPGPGPGPWALVPGPGPWSLVPGPGPKVPKGPKWRHFRGRPRGPGAQGAHGAPVRGRPRVPGALGAPGGPWAPCWGVPLGRFP